MTAPEAETSGEDDQELAPAARENIEVLADYKEKEEAKVPRLQAAIETLSDFFGSPAYLVCALSFILVWLVVNAWGWAAGWVHVDEPPFFWLQGLVTAHAFVITLAVLIRQNRMAKLATRRAHLDLHVNLLTERKVSKLLEVVEDLRRHLPTGKGDDAEARELAKSADPQAILTAINDSEEAAEAQLRRSPSDRKPA